LSAARAQRNCRLVRVGSRSVQFGASDQNRAASQACACWTAAPMLAPSSPDYCPNI
jgi:hypothetical protein